MKRPSEPSITRGRARRAARIGGLASQVGSSYLWNSLRGLFLDQDKSRAARIDAHIRNAQRIVEASKHLRGAFMKLVQMLSMRTDLLPPEAIDMLKLTQAEVPPMSYSVIAEQIRRELGASPEQLFASFEPRAFAAASLGQVHRAELSDGRTVAVKIQYPGIDCTVREDLGNLKLLLQVLQRLVRDVMRQQVDMRSVYEELNERLAEELDYKHEAANLKEFARLLADDPEVIIPEVIEEFTSRHVLTMTYVEGYPMRDLFLPGVDPALKSWLAHKYYELVWRQLLEFGVLHSDPQPGNYVVSHQPRLGILDFGSVRRATPEIQNAEVRFGRALLDNNEEEMVAALVSLGYLDPSQNASAMIEVVRMLFEPIVVDRVYNPNEYDSLDRLRIAGEVAFANRFYKSPPHGIFLARVLIGLDAILKQLAVPANYRRLFASVLRRAEQKLHAAKTKRK